MGVLSTLFDQIRSNRKHTEIITYRSATAGGQIIPWQADKPVWLPHTIDSYDDEAYRKVALIFRCVQFLANAAGTAKLRVYDPDGEEDETHPLRELVAKPNPGMGADRFLSFITMVMAVAGFVVIEKERDRAGNVIALWPLRSDWIRPVLRNQAAPDWEYRVPGRDPVMLDADDVIPIPFADTPDYSPTGIGPMASALREAQISSSLTDFVKAFMDRGALPLYAIIPQDEGPGSAQWKKQETKDAFMDAWRQRYQGLRNANDPLPLIGVKDIKRVGLDMNELAYADLNNRIDAAICQAFGIPPILVSAPVGLERSTFSNTAEARRSFYEDTMTYMWGRIDDGFTRHLLPDFEWRPGWDIHFDTSDIPALQDDVNDAYTRNVAAFSAGVISRHIAQSEMGVELHGPDEFLIGFSQTRIPVGNAARSRAVFDELDRRLNMHVLPSHDPKAPRYTMRDGRKYVNEIRRSPAEREVRAAILQTNQTTIAQLSDVIAPRLATFFGEQRNRMLAGITGYERSDGLLGREVRFTEVVDWANEDDLLRQLFAQWWETVTGSALGNAESLLGVDISWAVVNPYIAEVQGVLGKRIVGINEVTRADIERTLTTLMQEGTTVPQMGDAIRDLFDQTYANRHLTVARTESMVGYADASVRAYEASGVVQYVEVMDNASHTESYKGAADGLTCAQRNGLVVPLHMGNHHVQSDHPNGSASLAPIVTPLGGDE